MLRRSQRTPIGALSLALILVVGPPRGFAQDVQVDAQAVESQDASDLASAPSTLKGAIADSLAVAARTLDAHWISAEDPS